MHARDGRAKLSVVVNFIGHATVALWTRSEPTFVLGSMLPDFASMVGVRLLRGSAGEAGVSEPLAEGIALHHRTDEVFHAASAFTRLQQETLDALTEREVPRGAARAVGHIGVEMLIDGELVRLPQVAAAYVAALEAARDAHAPFRDDGDRSRFETLRRRLLAFGPPRDYADVDAVLGRLTHVLRQRPRLALDAQALPIVRQMLPTVQRKVVAALPALLADLREALR